MEWKRSAFAAAKEHNRLAEKMGNATDDMLRTSDSVRQGEASKTFTGANLGDTYLLAQVGRRELNDKQFGRQLKLFDFLFAIWRNLRGMS